jgi:hypothetical protein
MNDVVDALSTTATGGLVARAVEPAPGGVRAQAVEGHTQETACLNCGAALIGAHCHKCGQRAHVHRTLRAFAHDLLHGVLHFEGKTWRTLPLFIWKPGELTREYIDGKRASYVSPIALFLFVVFLSFAAFNILGSGSTAQMQASGMQAAEQAYEENRAALETLRKERETLAASDVGRRAQIDRRIEGLEDDQKGLSLVLGENGASVGAGIVQGPLADVVGHVRANPQLAIYKAQTNAYKYSWMLIPLSVPFVWLLFAFSRRFGAYDHTVFATYSIAFMIALVAIASLFFYAGWGGVGGLLLLYAPFHMYRQLRGTYALARFGAVWRMLALSLFAWVVIALFATVIGMLAA